MLPKSHHHVYISYDEGTKAVKYYNAETKTILTSRNFQFLVPSNSSPPKELLVEPGLNDSPLEGERDREDKHEDPTIPRKRPAEENIDPRSQRKTRGIRVD